MNPEVILERFLCLSGLSPEEAQPWQGLCEEAMQELSARAVPGAEDGAALLNAAAAALVFYRYSAAQSSGPESGFSAGDIRITKSAAGMEAAHRLWREARRAAAPYLRDDEFFFGQVRS